LGQHEQRKLWDLSGHISEEIKAKPVDTVVLSPMPGIAVYSQGNLLSTVVGGGSRTLLLGFPSLHGLSTGEFKAILAHEYGHFSNRDTQWNSLNYSMGGSLLSTFRSIPGPGAFRGSLGLIAGLNPAYWMMRAYVPLYFKVTSGFSRVREVMADIAALKLCGGKTFGQALLKEATNQALFSQVVQPKLLVELSRLGKKASNLSQSIETVCSSTEKSAMRDFQAALLSRAPTRGAYDSHPPLKVRLGYASKFEQRDETLGGPVQELFEDWKGLNERLTDFYYKRMPPKKCPRCGTFNEPFAERCRCGAVFIPPYRGPVRQLVRPPRSPNGMGEPKSQ
jgi:Zn-dependent protease with chaperone function